MFNFKFKFEEEYTAIVNEETGIAVVQIANVQQSIAIPKPVIQEYLKDPENEYRIIEMQLPFSIKVGSWLCTREEQDNRLLGMIVEAIKEGEIEGYKLGFSKENDPTLEFISPINSENSFGTTPLSDSAISTMTLYDGFIEWDVEELEIVEGIGIERVQDDNVVDGYDGVFELPIQAAILLYATGYGVDTDNLFEPFAIQNFFTEHNVKNRDFDRLLDNLEKLHP